MEELKIGVTRPRRAKLAPGGPVDAMAWKPIRPGRYTGYWESYKSEIAAYELDKFFGLGMIPPTVEKRVNGELGAAVMWASPTQSFKDLGGVPGQGNVKGPPPAQIARWMRQLTVAKMFDNLIGNTDPNLGNWLVDPSWNLILIDHTRAFTSTKNLYHQLVRRGRRAVGQDGGARRSEPDARCRRMARQGCDQGDARAAEQDAGSGRQAEEIGCLGCLGCRVPRVLVTGVRRVRGCVGCVGWRLVRGCRGQCHE